MALWSYPNPKGKAGKELCDLLAVCDPDIIIFSVRELKLGQSGKAHVDWERWQRKAIDASAKQIYGAERRLRGAKHVIRSNGSPGIALPDPARRRAHRVAVALGGKGKVPVYMGDLGKGFVHVLTEDSLEIVLGELDTVVDLTRYLRAVEDLQAAGTKVIFEGSEIDLLAMYLTQGRKLPTNVDLVVVADGIWADFSRRPGYRAKKRADRESYVWDGLVNILAEDALHGRMEFGKDLNQTELAIRTMAREDRFSRRVLGKGFKEFMDEAQKKKVRSRLMKAPSGIVYVFLATPYGTDRKIRVAELSNRCFVVRGLQTDATTVIGIATEQYERGQGFSLDVVHLYIPEWSAKHQAALDGMQRDLKYFVQPRKMAGFEDEYPNVEREGSA